MTSEADRRLLLQIARDAITTSVTGLPAGVPDLTEATARLSGAFVSLHRQGELRGCIGHIEPDQPLAHVVARCAAAASTADPRFPSVSPSELPELVIEVSILAPLERVASVEEIEIGRHGLVVEMGWQRGLLLPQVATEWRWDREMFMMETCHKAGLPRDAWLQGATIWRFEAEVFGEMPSLLFR